jgi:hypothetical protein
LIVEGNGGILKKLYAVHDWRICGEDHLLSGTGATAMLYLFQRRVETPFTGRPEAAASSLG